MIPIKGKRSVKTSRISSKTKPETPDSDPDPDPDALNYPILSMLSLNQASVYEALENAEKGVLEETVGSLPTQHKIVLVGEGGVGKTSLRLRFMGKSTEGVYLSTLGADFSVKSLTVDGTEVVMQIWDVAGQKRFREVITGYFRGATGAMVVYDVTRAATFDEIRYWVNHLWNITGPIPFVILGNKIDLEPEDTSLVTSHQDRIVQSLSDRTQSDFGFPVGGYFTSALTGENVEEAFSWLASAILGRSDKG